jgi:hypothetical protein
MKRVESLASKLLGVKGLKTSVYGHGGDEGQATQ